MGIQPVRNRERKRGVAEVGVERDEKKGGGGRRKERRERERAMEFFFFPPSSFFCFLSSFSLSFCPTFSPSPHSLSSSRPSQ